MAINWNEVVSQNVQTIVETAKGIAQVADAVCVLFDIDDVRQGNGTPGLQQIIAVSELKGGVPILAPDGNRLVCLPMSASKMISSLEEHEDVTYLRDRIRTGYSLVLWAICFDRDQRTCVDIHVESPEFN
jgi:hypothetical protein